MRNKLQELTDKLYEEGLSKGKQEAESLLENANKQAEQILSEANSQADAIVAKAQKEADDIKSKVNGDVKMASLKTISSLKQQIEQSLMNKVIGKGVKNALADTDFIKPLIELVIKSFDAANIAPAGLDVLLPETMKATLGDAFQAKLAKELNSSVNISFAKGISAGFKIAPKDGGYYISFTDGDFEKMLSEYLRPAAKKILFAEQ